MSAGKTNSRKYCRISGVATWLLLALMLWNFSPAAAAGPSPAGQAAPVNPDFEAWLQNKNTKLVQTAQNNAQSVITGPQSIDRPLGLIPRPIDLRHLDRIPVSAAARLQNKATILSQAASSGTQSSAGGTVGLPATFD